MAPSARLRDAVLVTRPEPGLSETMAAVAEMGFEPVACPLLSIRAVAARLPPADRIAAILVTSGQAVAPLAAGAAMRAMPLAAMQAMPLAAMQAMPLFAVGDATAARARAAGFADVRTAAGDADDLARLVVAALPAGAALLLATAAGQGGALAGRLREAGHTVHRRVLYRARPARILPDAAGAALRSGRLAACLFFSAGTARNFIRLLPVARNPELGAVRAIGLSAPVGAVLASLPWLRIEIAARPDAASLLSLLRSPP